MPRLRTQAAKDSLLRRVRKQRLNYITILPSLITILNGVCGFAAIVFASAGEFAKAGYLILLAMIADMLDGRVARMSRNTSSFGGQLDSICDIISFGVAPAFLTLEILQHYLKLVELNLPHRFIWLAAAAYISCAAIRLARFNVENEEDESAHMSFIGLPTPAAAGVTVSLVIFHQETLPELFKNTQNSHAQLIFENAIIYTLPFLLLAAAILMVSRIRYPHVLNQYIKGKKPFAHLIRVLLVLGLIIWSRQTVLVLCFCGFAASGFVKWFYYKVIRKKTKLAAATNNLAQIALEKPDLELQDENI
jgi:CDP-diacylglycerol--serine O-phosphatidyltransferase